MRHANRRADLQKDCCWAEEFLCRAFRFLVGMESVHSVFI